MTSAYPGDFYPGQVYPSQLSVGPTPDSAPSRHVRVEVAWASSPEATTPAWRDMSSRLLISSGIKTSCGRSNEFDSIQPGTMQLTFDNRDGALTADDPSSPYYPYVLPQRRVRLTYRDPATLGDYNLVGSESASFEGGTGGSWTTNGVAGTSLSNSTTRAFDGTHSAVITLPTASAGTSPGIKITIAGLVIGRAYVAGVQVWTSATCDPTFSVSGIGGATATTSTKSAWALLTFTFTATANSHIFNVTTASATTSGQQIFVDAFMVDEGTTLGTFTTTFPGSTVILPLFDGYVDEWPLEWPGGSDQWSEARITAADLLARIGKRRKLGSVVTETFAQNGPWLHYPLGESSSSVVASDVSGNLAPDLTIAQIGSGGTITFASGTGVPTDGLSAPVFAPASTTAGKYLTARNIPPVSPAGTYTIGIDFASSATFPGSPVGLGDGFGNAIYFNVTNAGVDLVCLNSNGPSSGGYSGTFNDGKTHQLRAVAVQGSGVVAMQLYVDGVLRSSFNASGALAQMSTLYLGGGGPLTMFTGTLSHAVAYELNLDATTLGNHRTATTTGFAGESVTARLGRICDWIGLPSTKRAFDTSSTTSVAHFDSSGSSPLDYMRKLVDDTERGLLFTDAAGKLTFYSRARRYTQQTADFTVPARMLGESARMVKNTELIVNDVKASRQDGASVRLSDATSIDTFGWFSDDIELLTSSDAEVAYAAGWAMHTGKDPQMRFVQVELDAYTETTYSPAILYGIALGGRMTITGMPAQAPASTLDQIVEGWTQSITESSWSFAVNASNYTAQLAFVLDDTTYGVLDTTNRIAY